MSFNRWCTKNAETWLVPRWHLVVEHDESVPPGDWWFEGVSGAEGSSGQQISWQASFLPIMAITSHSVCEQSLICKRQTFMLRYLWAWCSVGARSQSGHRGRSLCGQWERYNNSLIPAKVLFYFVFFVRLFFGLWRKSRHIVFYSGQLVTYSSADLTHFMVQILLLHIILTDRL